MRKATLERKISPLKEKIAKLQKEIEPLESLRSQFQFHIGRFAVSIGLPITIVAMIVDAAVNYSFLQTVLLSNATLLMITVICMSVMSDGSMWALGTFLSHRGENFQTFVLDHLCWSGKYVYPVRCGFCHGTLGFYGCYIWNHQCCW